MVMDTSASGGASPELDYTVELRWSAETQAWWKTRHRGSPHQIAAALDELVIRIRLDPAVARASQSGTAQVRYRAVGWLNRKVVEQTIETVAIVQLPGVLRNHATALRQSLPRRR